MIVWTWLAWWRVRHAALARINFGWTPFAAAVCAITVWLAPGSLNIFGAGGVVYQVNGLIPVLAGFFVASLAAIATFNRPSLDDVMGGIAPSVVLTGSRDAERLTRRRFLCMLFGYLAGASIAIYLIGSTATVFAPVYTAAHWMTPLLKHVIRTVFSALYLGVLTHIILTSFVGLYYLIDRIHQTSSAIGFTQAAKATSSNDAADS